MKTNGKQGIRRLFMLPIHNFFIQNIEDFIANYNDDPKPYVWTASAQQIIDKVNRCRAILETLH